MSFRYRRASWGVMGVLGCPGGGVVRLTTVKVDLFVHMIVLFPLTLQVVRT